MRRCMSEENKKSIREQREWLRGEAVPDDSLCDESRKFSRVGVHGHLDFVTCDSSVEHFQGDIENVSQFGLLFRAKKAIPVGTLLALRIDAQEVLDAINTTDYMREDNGDVLGIVVRVSAIDESTDVDIAVNLFKQEM